MRLKGDERLFEVSVDLGTRMARTRQSERVLLAQHRQMKHRRRLRNYVCVRVEIRGQPDRRGGIASDWLCQHVSFRQLRELLDDRRAEIVVGDDPEFLGRRERQEARDRLLDHGLLAVEREQLLGPFFPAERPETRAPASGENHGIEVGVLAHACDFQILDFRLVGEG